MTQSGNAVHFKEYIDIYELCFLQLTIFNELIHFLMLMECTYSYLIIFFSKEQFCHVYTKFLANP